MDAAHAKLVELSTINLKYANQTFELAEKRFKLGTLNSVDLMVFENNYQNQVLQYYEFLYNKVNTFLEIYRLTGKLSLEYGNN